MEFNKIYSDYHLEIENQIKYRIKNQEDAEEIASEVFVKVHANLHTFNEELAGIRTWIWRIANNLMIDHFRKKRLFFESIDDDRHDKQDFLLQIKMDGNPLMELESNELGEHILNAMVDLPSSVSDVAEKYFIGEETYKEIAEGLNIPMGTVKAHIFRAKEYLRNRLVAFR